MLGGQFVAKVGRMSQEARRLSVAERFVPEPSDLRRIAVAAELSDRTVRRWYEVPFRATWGNRARLKRAVLELGVRPPDPEPPGGWSSPVGDDE